MVGGAATFRTSPALQMGFLAGATGTVWITGGQLTTINGVIHIAGSGVGQMTVSNGTWLAADVQVGTSAGSRGTLTIAGGTNAMIGPLNIGGSGTGTVIITGGQLVLTNTPADVGVGSGFVIDGRVTLTNGSAIIATNVNTLIGKLGSGSLTMAGGSMRVLSLSVGGSAGFTSTLTLNGGTLEVVGTGLGGLGLGGAVGATGTVWVTGGQLILTNRQISAGFKGHGEIIISNGIVSASDVFLGTTTGVGVGTMFNGTMNVSSTMTLGSSDCLSIGIQTINGGELVVTNATHTAMIDVRSGTLTLGSGGTLRADNIFLTNSCSRFINQGGTYSASFTAPGNLDADGDGMPNAYEDSHGFDKFDPTDAAQDADGDGFTNLEEFKAGTDPHDSASAMRIIEISQQTSNIRVKWTMARGTTNVLERTTGGPGGSYSATNFTTVATISSIGGSGMVTNSVLDGGAATNFPACYYRVRLAP